MSRGVEWAVHCCLTLAMSGDDEALTADELARFFDLPKAYLHKQIQALVRAGILSSTPGPGGGYGLARPLDAVSLMDVVVAIDGPEPAFRCEEIRQRGGAGAVGGPIDPGTRCLVDQAMGRADLAWRRELAATSLATIQADVESARPTLAKSTRDWFADQPH